MKIKRIAITGPESTGKSTLSLQLSEYYKDVLVPEMAREYLTTLGKAYEYTDVEHIARLQVEAERKALPFARKILFADTGLIVIKIWVEYKYGKVPHWIEDAIAENPYDLYLLCNFDLPWIPDPLREHPKQRAYLFEKYKQELEKRKLRYEVISGVGEERFTLATKAVNSLLNL